MTAIKKQRNNLVELAWFLFSLLVIGYHVQMTWAGDGSQFFAGGALAVLRFKCHFGVGIC